MKKPPAIAVAFLAASIASAAAQTYPSRPVTIVVPFPAGGPTDALARVLAERMKGALGQSVIVENPTGAAGTIGTGRVARAAPDGYTVILGHWQTHVVNGATYALPFDVVEDFEPISLVADCPVWFVAKAALPPKDLAELIAWMKENPGKATVGIGGVGGGADVVGTYFQKNTGTRFQFVPYRGAAPMIDEAGVPGLHASFWHGFWAPKATPKDVIAKLHAAVVETLADPSVRQRLADLGQGIWPREQQTPEALAAQQKAEIEKWWPVIKAQ